MAQRFAVSDSGPDSDPDRAALDRALSSLPESWILLRDLEIDGVRAEFLLVQPDVGIALVELSPGDPAPAAAAIGQRLKTERFADFYPGTLPVVAVTVAPDGIPGVGERLADAFEAAPQLGITDGDWLEAVIELLLPAAPTPVDGNAEHEPDEDIEEPAFADIVPPQPVADTVYARPAEPQTPLRLEAPMRDEAVAESHEPAGRRVLRNAGLAVGVFALFAAAAVMLDRGGPSPGPIPIAEVQLPPLPPPQARTVTPSPSMAEVPPPPPAPVRAPPPETRLAALPPPVEPLAPLRPPEAQPPTLAARGSAVAPPPLPPTPTAPAAIAESVPSPPAPTRFATAPRNPPKPARPVVLATHTPQPEGPNRLPRSGSSARPAGDLPPIDATDLPPLDEAPRPPFQDSEPVPAAPVLPAAGSPARYVPGPAAGGETRECRQYTATQTITGRIEPVRGIACRTGNGQWQLVSELPLR